MSGNDALENRRRIQEEGYFAEKERELIEKLRQKAEEAAERRSMGETLGVADEAVIAELCELGFTRETLALLHLTPLVRMAWASGGVSKGERAAIVEAAQSRGVEPGSAADKQLTEWLDVRPTDEFFARSLRAIRAFVSALPAGEREAGAMDIVECCLAVARVSGGVLGLGSKVCDRERAVLEHVAAEMAATHQAEAEAIEEKLG